MASLYKDQLVQGTLPGFIVVKPSGQTEAYAWNRATYSSVESEKPYNPTTVEIAEGPIYLFYNLDQECGKKAYMVVRYSDLSEVFEYKRRGQIEQAQRALLRVIERNQASSKVLKCEDSRKSSNDAWVEQPIPLNCGSGDIVALQRRYQETLKSKLDGSLDELVGLLKQYQDEPCFFEHVGIHERIKILNRLIRDDVDDSIWEFSYGKLSVGDTFFLDKLLLSTPESDRLTLLRDGLMANGGKWLQILFSKSKGFWNNDVTIPDLLPLMSELGHWVQLYYKDLSIPITTGVVNGIGISGFDELKYSLASVTPVCLGTGRDSDNFFYTRQADNGLLYDLRLNPNSWGRIVFQDGHITFVQHFAGKLRGEYLHTSDKRLPRAYNITTQLSVSPFEPVVIIASRDYQGLGIKAGVEYTIPAFLAAVYQQYLADKALEQDVRTLGNYAAIGAAVLSAPLTEGGSLAAYSAIASGIVAAADEALKSGRLKLGSNGAYDAQYEAFYQAWEQLYNVAAWTDGGVGVAQLYRSIRAVSIAKSIKRLAAESKLCGRSNSFKALWKGRNVEEAVSKLVDNLDLGASVGKIGDYEVYEKGEVFYRTMSREDYEVLIKTNRMPGTGETTTSPTMSFSENYEGILVQFKVKRGTIRNLEEIGIAGRNHPGILVQHPLLKADKSPWSLENARFKLENGQVNIALGRGKALEIFNDNILEYKFIKQIYRQ